MRASEYPERLDFGEGRFMEFTRHDGWVVGALETHPSLTDGSPCVGSLFFDVPEVRKVYLDQSQHNRWTVESWEPLTLSPSLLCRACGNHGFVRQGKWVPA